MGKKHKNMKAIQLRGLCCQLSFDLSAIICCGFHPPFPPQDMFVRVAHKIFELNFSL